MRKEESNFNREREPRALPSYGIVEAAHYLLVPQATLRSWVTGRCLPGMTVQKFFEEPIIRLPNPEGTLTLSFMNLVEAYILDAIRRVHQIPSRKLREAVKSVPEKSRSRNPLAHQRFVETSWLECFIHKYGERHRLEAYLCRIERDETGLPAKLYPFTIRLKLGREFEAPKVVVIDPYVSFGRPVLVGTGIPIAVIAERFKAGESIEELADDYARQPKEIEDAIRCELQIKAA